MSLAATSPNAGSELEQARPQTSGEEELQLQLALAMSREAAEQVDTHTHTHASPSLFLFIFSLSLSLNCGALPNFIVLGSPNRKAVKLPGLGLPELSYWAKFDVTEFIEVHLEQNIEIFKQWVKNPAALKYNITNTSN